MCVYVWVCVCVWAYISVEACVLRCATIYMPALTDIVHSVSLSHCNSTLSKPLDNDLPGVVLVQIWTPVMTAEKNCSHWDCLKNTVLKKKVWRVTLRGIVKGSQTQLFSVLALLWLYLGCCFSPPPVSPSPLSLCDPYHCSPEREERWQTNLFIISRFSWLNCYSSWTL